MLQHLAVRVFPGFLLVVLMALPVQAANMRVFVAASLVDVIGDFADSFEKATGRAVDVVPGASSTLARQIVTGAPADLFISADRANVDIVAKEVGAEVYDLFGNRLAIIAPDSFDGVMTLKKLARALGNGRLAIGDTAHVPAGIYAREALENAGVWDRLKDQLAPASDVRGAVAFVAQGATPFGIVYQTDVVVDGVKVAGKIDPELYTPIRYWGVIVDAESVTADMFLSHIGSFKGQNLLEYYGFKTMISLDE